MKPKVLVADKLSQEGVDILKTACAVTVKTGMKEAELIKEIPAYDAIMVRSATKVTAKVIKAGKKLRIIARAGVGVDNIDTVAATQAGIVVVNSPTGNITAAAELALAHIFALARHLPQADRSMREGKWDPKSYMGSQISDKTIGIVGFGKIGQIVGNAAVALGMNALVYDPVVSEEVAAQHGCKLVCIEALLKKSDFITLHVPKSAATYHFISDKEFAMMKTGVRIVNCSRGGVVDEAALARAIKKGKVAGAALDVFETEPPGAESELITLPNVILTPHLGASTHEAQVNVAVDVAKQVMGFFKGEFPTSAVNMPSLSPEILHTHQPFFTLAEKIGTLQAGLIGGTVKSVEIRYEGNVSRMQRDLITRNFLVGLLRSRYDDVNVVNAPSMIKDRGVNMSETFSDAHSRFTDLIVTKVVSSKGTHTVSGTLSMDGTPRVVDIDGYDFDLVPEGHFLLITHRDQPGIIGLVGTLLGNANINIAGMQVGRKAVRGDAIMATLVDDDVSDDIMKIMKKLKGIRTVHNIGF